MEELTPLYVFKQNVYVLVILERVKQLDDVRALNLAVNSYFVERGGSRLLLGEHLLVEHLHCVDVSRDSTLDLVDVGAGTLAERLPDDLIVMQARHEGLC